MTPKTCLFYVTLRCNDTCEFCHCWQNSSDQNIRESAISEVLPSLKEARIRGAEVLEITGGEPLLRDDLPEILRATKNLGFHINLTTNGILYAEKGKLLTGLLDDLRFSLDYPVSSEHDRSRGVDCFQEVISAIKLAKQWGERPRIIFTLTRDSIRYLPEMHELAERLQVLVYLNPVYDFQGTQGFEPATLEHIKYYGKKKNILVNLAALEFIKAGGNRVYFPRCRARETTITLLPDGNRASPCFYNQGGKQGKEDVCSSCMRWPYMLPSFGVGWDRYHWLDRYSEWSNRRKITNF